MNLDEIKELLPHREPFLMVDALVELDPGERAVGVKEVRHDEWWCAGHFPGNPIMPGVLVAESLAQVAGLVFLSGHRDQAGGAVYLVGMDKMRFRKPVRPGDTLRLEVEVTSRRRRIWMFSATARVGDQRVANGELMATMDQAPQTNRPAADS